MATYQINLESLNKVSVENRLNPNYLKVKLNEVGKEGLKNILGNLSTTETTIADTYESHKLMTGYLEPNDTKNFELRLWLDENVTKEDEVMDKQFKSKISVTSTYIEEEDVLTFAESVVKCGQEGDSATTCITDNMNLDENLFYDDFTNIRFTGANPNNYVLFNDGELWRIIGIVDNKLKILRGESIGVKQWHSISNNIWSSSDIENYLNNSYNINSDLIEEEQWNVGNLDGTSHTANQSYYLEKNNKWTGRVGLIAASDYGYAVGGNVRNTCLGINLNDYNTNECTTNDWLNLGEGWLWTITAQSSSNYIAFSVNAAGSLSVDDIKLYRHVFPVVYLKSSTRIIDGTGEEESPFILE